MLKIKDNIDLKILQYKYNFHYAYDTRKYIDKFYSIFINERSHLIIIQNDCLHINESIDILYNLIEDGLVEKAGEYYEHN